MRGAELCTGDVGGAEGSEAEARVGEEKACVGGGTATDGGLTSRRPRLGEESSCELPTGDEKDAAKAEEESGGVGSG